MAQFHVIHKMDKIDKKVFEHCLHLRVVRATLRSLS